MPIRAFLEESRFDLDEIEILNTAFLGACDDLGLKDKTDAACKLIAERVVQMANQHRDPEAIRAAVVASFGGVGP